MLGPSPVEGCGRWRGDCEFFASVGGIEPDLVPQGEQSPSASRLSSRRTTTYWIRSTGYSCPAPISPRRLCLKA